MTRTQPNDPRRTSRFRFRFLWACLHSSPPPPSVSLASYFLVSILLHPVAFLPIPPSPRFPHPGLSHSPLPSYLDILRKLHPNNEVALKVFRSVRNAPYCLNISVEFKTWIDFKCHFQDSPRGWRCCLNKSKVWVAETTKQRRSGAVCLHSSATHIAFDCIKQFTL